MLVNAAVSALMNLLVFVVIPGAVYGAYVKRKASLPFKDITDRMGLRIGGLRYAGYAAVAATAIAVGLVVFPPPIEALARQGSAQRAFVGLGITPTSLLMAVLYGIVQTGLAEEVFFRGLVAGSLARRLTASVANVLQAMIFLIPHLLILSFAPEAWWVLLVIFAGALFVGWLRVASGSVLGPWIVHAAVNVTMALSIAVRSTS